MLSWSRLENRFLKIDFMTWKRKKEFFCMMTTWQGRRVWAEIKGGRLCESEYPEWKLLTRRNSSKWRFIPPSPCGERRRPTNLRTTEETLQSFSRVSFSVNRNGKTPPPLFLFVFFLFFWSAGAIKRSTFQTQIAILSVSVPLPVGRKA